MRASNPVVANSSTSGGQAREHSTIRRSISCVTTLDTNTPVSSTFRSVSSFKPTRPGVREHVNEISGGFTQATVFQLNGAALKMPSAPTVEMSAIGRGTMIPVRSL